MFTALALLLFGLIMVALVYIGMGLLFVALVLDHSTVKNIIL